MAHTEILAVTAVIIGPRTPEQFEGQLDGADAELSEDSLDRIDAIVPPGRDLNSAENYNVAPPAMLDKRLRRR